MIKQLYISYACRSIPMALSPKKYAGRYAGIYLPSEKFLQE